MFDPTTWDAPFGVVVLALFVIVMLRANGTYWVGRALAAGARRSRWEKILESRHYATGARWLNRWGPPAVSLSFLTIGIQTMVNLAAGVAQMPMRRYLPAVTVGCLLWAFMYGTVGFIGWVAVAALWERSPGLTVALLALAVAGVAWALARRDRISVAAPAE